MKTTTYSQDKTLRDEFALSQSTKNIILKRSLMTLIGVAICLLVNVVMRVDYILLGNTLGELSLTEGLEQVMLIIASGSFFYLASQQPKLKHAATLIAAFFLVMLIRENDALFDYIAHGFWRYPAMAVAFSAIAYAVRNGKQSLDQLAVILNNRNMGMLLLGIVLLLVYSRLFGMGNFWKGVMQEHYVRDVKNIAEEGTELLAYCIIAFSSCRLARCFRKQH
ncbi:hypothetical protein [Vibrio panuliri]|uniref:Uncharacterized protein n=1 Tax=Vibrio panuliri TaxID=1381081 RepID=A0A1Q9HCP6_9VIBR|nr:hypothetical protein [Vibrio panuliri]KAB1455215.1 hypothetical protein F7O85_20485 [Vibrio panuliri]OLQ87165.1 hypothetical protein BIY22_11395 [Vibrio panuliri]OLQ88761.1 hypothetical protein BIY20_12690 [Vibrio panuliri]